MHTGQLAAATDALRSAVELADRVRLKDLRRNVKASALAEMGVVAHAKGELATALVHVEESLRLWREEPKRKDQELKALNDLGMIHRRLGLPDSAKRYLEKSLELARERDDVEMLARIHNNLGVLMAEENRYDVAITRIETSIALRQSLGDVRGTALSRYNLADTLWALGRREEASRTLEFALEGYRKVQDLEGEASGLRRAAMYQRLQGKPDEAVKIASKVIELSRDMGFQWPLWKAYVERAAAHQDVGRRALALADFERALGVIESLRARLETGEFKMRFVADKSVLYERTVVLKAALEEEPSAGAFQLAERARARSLLDLLTESRLSPTVGLPEDLANREKKVTDEVSVAAVRLAKADDDEARRVARQALDAAEETRQRLELEIRRRAPRYSDIVYTEPSSLKAIQTNVLKADETLLRYFIGEEHSMLWVVDRDQARLQKLPPRTEIASLVDRFLETAGRESLTLGHRLAGESESRELADALGVSDLPAGRRLLVVPDGPLHHLPFDVLRPKGRYLIEDHEIVVVPSATTLKLMREQPTRMAERGFLGIGDPQTATGDLRFPPLPHTDEALDSIARLFAEDQRVILKGERSTKDELRSLPLDRFRYVHLATHGWLDADRSGFFGLRLRASSEEATEEFLHLDEVLSMKLGAELVVLSACNSGLGEMLEGEGLVGMTRGFLYAGARSLLVSLWNVNDRSAADFMREFYAELVEGRSIPEALRRTKLGFIASDRRGRRQPYHWAPFVLVGDPSDSGNPELRIQGSTTSKLNDSSGSVPPDS
jgi:CHAT domain-containing protein